MLALKRLHKFKSHYYINHYVMIGSEREYQNIQTLALPMMISVSRPIFILCIFQKLELTLKNHMVNPKRNHWKSIIRFMTKETRSWRLRGSNLGDDVLVCREMGLTEFADVDVPFQINHKNPTHLWIKKISLALRESNNKNKIESMVYNERRRKLRGK